MGCSLMFPASAKTQTDYKDTIKIAHLQIFPKKNCSFLTFFMPEYQLCMTMLVTTRFTTPKKSIALAIIFDITNCDFKFSAHS